LYDSFILAEDGQVNESLLTESVELNLHHPPRLTHVASGAEAIALARDDPRHHLIIASTHVGDMDAPDLARRVEHAHLDTPIVVLGYDARALTDIAARGGFGGVSGVYLWQGDVRILLAIVRQIEDWRNLAHDVGVRGVQAIIVIEDNIRYYSSFLPIVYAEVLNQSHNLVPEGLNVAHKLMRLRARPKILLCRTFEEAWGVFTAYRENVLGVISDIEFPRAGRLSREAGVEFARSIRREQPDVPVMLQSSRPQNEALARSVGASFALKGSPTLLQELRTFMSDHFGFGDFVFRTADGVELGRAHDLKALEEKLCTISAASLAYHAERNHFSKWLKARTEFAVAHSLRPRKVSDFATVEDLRAELIRSIHQYRRQQGRATVADFDRNAFDPEAGLARIGGGSLGGKARGLAFVNALLDEEDTRSMFHGVQIAVPPAVVLGTDVFDAFLERHDLRDFALHAADDGEILRRFMACDLPDAVTRDLASFLDAARYPLAVRSSSLLEDSQYQPFAGVYDTCMLPNSHSEPKTRLRQLVSAIKRVYASTFSHRAKAYLDATPYRLEEEKMAVILQRVVGAARGHLFYPHFAGVARSYNFYPVAPMAREDGIAAVAAGLGTAVVDGEVCVRFCPKYPRHVVQFSTSHDAVVNSQRQFYALPLDEPGGEMTWSVRSYDLDVAERDGVLASVGSTYSAENDAIYDGVSRPGIRLVTFAPVLKHGVFPLAPILRFLLDLGSKAASAPVEIEFAVDVTSRGAGQFGFLQLRPLALSRELEELEIAGVDPDSLVCQSSAVLGHGRLDNLRDVIFVNVQRFERGGSADIAREVARMNALLARDGVPYILIGVGRWGSTEPLLGIPVTWDQIAGVRVIVEAGFQDVRVAPSQGTHFFQNLTASRVGYFTVNPESGEGFVDWEWLARQPAVRGSRVVRHLHFERPLVVKMNGKRHEGVILKP
jgi:CheY-like chemotaxis protein